MNDCCARPSALSTPAVMPDTTLPSYAVRPGVTIPDWSVVTSPTAREALLAILEAFNMERAFQAYTLAEDGVRTPLLHLYAEEGRAPSIGELAERAGVSENAIRSILASLRARDLVVLDADGERIVGAYPFTNRDTGHRVRLGDRTLNAMCAIDALGAGAMYGRDVEIRSRCRSCGAPIMIATGDRGRAIEVVKPATAVVWSGIRDTDGCAANSLCTVIDFFCDDTHLRAWRTEHHPKSPGFRLSIDEAQEIGWALFGPSLVGVGDDSSSETSVRSEEKLRPTGAGNGDANKPTNKSRSGRNGRNGVRYDLAVVGAGSAGFSAATTAADEGAQVALIGHGTIGGTCVNVGCVPSKMLIRAAESLHAARAAGRFAGIQASARVTDWQQLVRQKQELVDDLRKAKYSDLLPAYNSIAYAEGRASFSDAGTLTVNGRALEAGKIIIATGARPAVPSIAGMEAVPYLTSTTALELETLPSSLLVIGAGYVGAEIAQLFARAGVQVTLASRRGLLPEAEPEIGAALTRYFTDEGIRVVSGIVYERIERDGETVRLHVKGEHGPEMLTADTALIATGRTPNTEDLNLAAAGVETRANNGIKVDAQMRTTRDGVYAAGDVTGGDQFVYMAAYGAKIAARNALKGNALSYDNSAMPAIVFTDPQVASVGLTEANAHAQGFQVKTSVLALDNVPRALAARDTRGLIKLIADRRRGKLLGAHVLAPEGADSIQSAALAIKAGMTYAELAETIFPYLTTVEGLKLAALAFDRDVAKLSCCAG